jgi:hypothetical protein
MSRDRLRLSLASAFLILACRAPDAAADRWWIPVVAHAPGFGGSAWRSDVTVLSLCGADASITLRLNFGGGVTTRSIPLPGWSQQVVTDVVLQMVPGDAVGALEVEADVPIAATSRTYDASSAQPGTVIEGVAPNDGLSAGDEAFIPALSESGATRTNVGVLNTGLSPAEVDVFLADRGGREVGRFTLAVLPGGVVQDNRPFRLRFSRDDIEGGSARVRVVSGSGVWAWGSVIDQATGNALALRARKAGAACQTDIAAELAKIGGLVATEASTTLVGYRRFELRFPQPADHSRPDGPGFPQSITLLHRSFDAPVVLETLGYAGGLEDARDEPTVLFGANQIVVEHRFFGTSRPSVEDWSLLTIRQAADDVHRVVETFRRVYRGRWVSAGHSKGGLAAVYHRRFHPDDVHATVAYVAPNSLGAPDPRYLGFVAGVGTETCRRSVENAQRQLLVRRQAMLTRLAGLQGLTFQKIGGRDAALESVALDTPFTFWQYAGVEKCPLVPLAGASDNQLFAFADGVVGFDSASDAFFDAFAAYFVQAATQLGYPALSRANVADLLRATGDHDRGVLPDGVTATYDPSAMPEVASWLSAEGSRILFVYGQWDPWTAGAFDPGGAADTHVFLQPEGTHNALISMLAAGDRNRALAVLERWTGVRAQPVAPAVQSRMIDEMRLWHGRSLR